VTDEAAWPGIIAAVEARFGRLDVVVANAGIAIVTSIEAMSLADWRRQTAVNIDGVFLAAKHAIPALRRAGGGSIVMLSSVAGLRGSAGLAGYSATKGAVRMFAKSVALECAADRIRCNSVHPGIIETAIWAKMPTEATDSRRGNAPIDPKLVAAAVVPGGVIGQPEDVAETVLFLASDASRYVNGSELVVDGGMTAGRAGSLAAR
jgi:NAD(P)-dependent dehydrogenase (short-subunit alcohol dehydrogenase family)